MSIEIMIPPLLSSYANNQYRFKVSGSTIGECLRQLTEQFPTLRQPLFDKEGKLSPYAGVYVNQATRPGPLTQPVKDGDRLRVMMLISGG